MSAELDFYNALLADAPVTALVGQRIFPDVAIEGVALPLVVFERTATAPVLTIHDDLPVAAAVTISASVWAVTGLSAWTIGDAILVALRGIGTETNRFTSFDEDTGLHAAVIDFEIWEL